MKNFWIMTVWLALWALFASLSEILHAQFAWRHVSELVALTCAMFAGRKSIDVF